MNRTKSIYLALLAVLLSPMAANADLIEVVFTGTGSYWDYVSNLSIYGATLTSTYTFDTDDLPADQDSNADIGDYYDNLTNWLTATLSVSGGYSADQADVDQGNNSDENDFLYIDNSASSEYLFLRSRGETNDEPNGFFDAYAYWESSSDFGCINGQTINDVVASCDTSGLSRTYQEFLQYDSDDDPYVLAEGNVTNVTVRRVAVPEPSTLALLGLGLVGMAARRRKKV